MIDPLIPFGILKIFLLKSEKVPRKCDETVKQLQAGFAAVVARFKVPQDNPGCLTV